MSATTAQADIQVLKFQLDEGEYCIDIDDVAEIVDRPAECTRIPRSPPFVEGVVNLRGNTTTIVDPKPLLGLEGTQPEKRVIIFDSGDSVKTGWLVDEVRQVVNVVDDDVDTSVEGEGVKGLVRHDDGFLVWLDPTVLGTDVE
jgi:purine-binding chemotaxis protein CheW